MIDLKNNTLLTKESKKGKIFDSQNKDIEKEGQIDIIDLEIDFLKHKETHGNLFPIEIYPKAIQEIIIEVHNKNLFPIDYLGAGILSAASTSIGKSHKIKVKDDWEEKVNLFMVIVGQPGDAKTQSLKFCFKPIQIKESQLYIEYEKQLAEYERNNPDNTENKFKEKKPILKKYLLSDFTPEALILNHTYNKRGMCIYVDELKGWLKNFNRYNSSNEEENYLSFWSGTEISTDRTSVKSLRLDDPCLSVVGSTQISVLKDFGKDGRSTNGFMDRLLFVYPNEEKILQWNIESINKVLFNNYNALIHNLIEIGDEDPNVSTVIEIEPEAKEYLFRWQNNRPYKFFFDYERSIEIKLQQYVLRFTLILHLIHSIVECKSKNKIEIYSIKGAIKLFDYFLNNAIKVRTEILKKNYFETLTELQKNILNELPKTFTTAEGIKIACKLIEGKPRVSDRQFKTYLKDLKLFKRLAHGSYEKIV
ncbi:DUF3987 domain-containing protein [Flavobacterium sufflavum]|uniref:DUF3987 domain-containing protein n=1 Tax=Flavobacterium sufflavum TaxID=1921138 RepID=A0A3S2TY52_9FLAO|nr:DUF3987 domain-containing protein [Flavobacterium sufflavum]RVT71207.1 DUF3987 domain-containing protein [Flavobacterium sufflavum]